MKYCGVVVVGDCRGLWRVVEGCGVRGGGRGFGVGCEMSGCRHC